MKQARKINQTAVREVRARTKAYQKARWCYRCMLPWQPSCENHPAESGLAEAEIDDLAWEMRQNAD